jgi:hypothetical protein
MKSLKIYTVISVICLAAVSAEADNYSYWQGGPGGWSGPGSWSGGEPTTDTFAIVTYGTVPVTDSGEICKKLQLGMNGIGSATLLISSGSLEVTEYLFVGQLTDGSVNLSGGLLKAKTVAISSHKNTNPPSTFFISGNAELQSQYLEVGYPGVGSLTQNGGTITTNELALTNKNNYPYEEIAHEGYYTLNAGTLHAGAVYVGIQKGEFKITNPGVTINISDLFNVRYDGVFIAPAGTTLHLKGAKFLIEKLASSEIPDLANLTLSIEKRGGYESTLEALGADRGPTASVLTDNFALDTITVEPGTNLRLINTMDNNRDETASDVAVVRQLNLGNGSTLFLNNNKMYCQDWTHDCSTVDWGGNGCLYVLTASYQMTIGSSESEISADGQSECEISAVLSDRNVPICNANVRFNTDKGSFVGGSNPTAFWARTDAGGRATARLRSDTQPGKATVTANYMDYSKPITVDFVKVLLKVTADPSAIPADGTSRSMIRAILEDKHIPVSDQSILLETQVGHFITPGTGEWVSSITLITDADGKVIVELQSDTEEHGGYVTAT